MSDVIGGPFCKVTFEQTNINSPAQLKEFLLSQGWIPTSFTEKGSPQITEDSFGSIKGGLGQLIAERAVFKHRLGMLFNINDKTGELKGWINTIRDDGRIEAGGVPQATNTGRMRHSNVVNVPKAIDSVPYGIELRSLFIAPEGYKLIDIDASALEARMEAHYCFTFPGGVSHANDLLEGDIHTKTANAMGVDRPTAKTVRYAIMYGAQPKKISSTLGCSVGEATNIYNKFWQANTALGGLSKSVRNAYRNRGFLIGLDGRKLMIRSEHALVNTLFQSAGSIVVKTALCYIANRTKHLDSVQIGFFHDEGLYQVAEKDVEEFSRIAERSFEDAGKWYKLNIPMKGDAHVGRTWAEVH